MDNKFNEYTHAIEQYLNHTKYQRFETIVSFLIVTLQAVTLFNAAHTYEQASLPCILVTLLTAYVITDFINGLVHMYMDNNTQYTSMAGPYIAAFHLHHAKYVYQKRHLLKVYFDESGTKFWLLIYLLLLTNMQLNAHLSTPLNIGLTAFGIFSSIAELSHYWCHNATEQNKIILWLQNHYIFLSKKHHKSHHCSDNIQYAFLNGASDPAINFIARRLFNGYKNNADLHTKAYLQQAITTK